MLTVLITTYNSVSSIGDAIKSVLIQNFCAYELLIIDDGSDDFTESLVKSFNSLKIRYFKIPHSGRSAALNLGLKLAEYNWITLLDSDDLMAQGKLLFLAGSIPLRRNLVITTWMGVFAGDNIIYTVKYPEDDLSLKKFLLVHGFNNSVMFNKTFILDCGGYEDLRKAEDYDLWLRLINKAEFKCIPEFLTYHRFSKNSYSNRNYQELKAIVRFIQKKNKIELLDNLETEASERANIHLRREYFFGESILSTKQDELTLKYVLLLLLSLLPDSIGDYIRIINLKARFIYLLNFYSEENILLRKKFRNVIGDGNKVKVFNGRGDI